jgi:3-deoxy-7-phosphoheptulonate synthase
LKIDSFSKNPGISDMPMKVPYKLASLQAHPEYTQVRIGNVIIGGDKLVMVAGPCAIEGTKRALEIAREVKRHGADLFRGGAFKPRTSPYSFQGLGEYALHVLDDIRKETGLRVVSEIMSISQADKMMKHVDVLQIGSRNVQNFELLKCVGRMRKPVILKRGFATTIEEWLLSAEYILAEGNDQVILCERGIRTFETSTRNTLDLSAVALLKTLSHLPVMVDPSHATGLRELVIPMARAAVAAGADALMVEVHTDPDKAKSDGRQSIYPEQFKQLMEWVEVIAPLVRNRTD